MKNLKQKIQKQRSQKDEFFKGSPRSPIPREERKEFDGLNYFPIKPDLRFELKLKELEDKEKITTKDSKGGRQEFIRFGEFQFEINEGKYTLQAYKNKPRNKDFGCLLKIKQTETKPTEPVDTLI